MMEEEKKEVVEKEETTTTVVEKKEPSQTRTEKEKAEFSLKKTAERLKELGGDPNYILGVKPDIIKDSDEDDDTLLTIGKLKEYQKQSAKQTALQLAEELDESEREEVKALLASRITPSGDAHADLALARGAANARKNAMIAEEALRKTRPNLTASGGTQPGKPQEEFTPTADEMVFMRAPYNMSKEKILSLRKQ